MRKRRWAVGSAIGLAFILIATLALRTPAPIGHWDGAEGRDRFMTIYDEAFADLPEPEQTLDVRTDFGVVRARPTP